MPVDELARALWSDSYYCQSTRRKI